MVFLNKVQQSKCPKERERGDRNRNLVIVRALRNSRAGNQQGRSQSEGEDIVFGCTKTVRPEGDLLEHIRRDRSSYRPSNVGKKRGVGMGKKGTRFLYW